MKSFLSLGLFLFSITAWALPGDTADVQLTRDVLNNTPPGAIVRLGTKLVDRTVRHIRAKYDFSVLGGFSTQSVGGYALLDDEGKPIRLPANSIIKTVMVDVTQAVTAVSQGARIGIGVNTTTDLLGSTAPSSMTNGSLLAGVPVNTAATAVRVLSDKSVAATITSNDINQGKFFVLIDYIIVE